MSSLRSLYAWVLRQAEQPYAQPMLFLIAVAEAWIFIPADTLLIPMALARRDRSMLYAAIAASGLALSTLIGLSIGHMFIHHHELPDMFKQVQHGVDLFVIGLGAVRCARFFVEGWLIYKFGDPVRHFIEKHLPMIFFGALGVLCLGVFVVVNWHLSSAL